MTQGIGLGNDIPLAYRPITEPAREAVTRPPAGVKYVTAPNGRTVPVGHAQWKWDVSHHPIDGSERSRIEICDKRDIVSIAQNSIKNTGTLKSSWPDMDTFRADYNLQPYRSLEGVDYAQYGYTKIGRVWVDPQDREDVDYANELNLPCTEKIAKWIDNTGSWLITQFDPENTRHSTTNTLSNDPITKFGQQMDKTIAIEIEKGVNYWKSFLVG